MFIGFAAVFLTAFTIRKYDERPAHTSEMVCVGESAHKTTLIVGDSWATKGKLNGGYLSVVGQSSRVCSIGYSGATTHEVNLALKRDWNLILGEVGGLPSKAIVVVGLNDFVGQFGHQYYTDGLRQIVETLQIPASVLTLPHIEPGRDITGPGSLKRIARACTYNWCQFDHHSSYRARTGLTEIDYDAFTPQFRVNDFVDGIHLTEKMYFQLGTHIATVVN